MSRIITKERLATLVAAVILLYGVLRTLLGLMHLFLPSEALGVIPRFLGQVNSVQAISSGLLLLLLGRGLMRRSRLAYYIAIAVLGLTAGLGITTKGTSWLWSSAVILLLALLPLRGVFARRMERFLTPGQAVALMVILLALAYGVVGSYLLREQFSHLETWEDALYFTVVTFTTLGYGDIVPKPESPTAKLFAVTMVIVGISSFITAISVIVGPLVESQLKGVIRTMDRFRKRPFQDHVIVCYYTQVGESVVDELKGSEQDLVVIEPDKWVAESLQAEGIEVLQGDPTNEEALYKAHLEEAQAIVACSDTDADNAMITLIAHEIKASKRNAKLRIIARVEQEEGVSKLRAAGADYVISPSTLGGRMMGKLAAGQAEETVKEELRGLMLGGPQEAG